MSRAAWIRIIIVALLVVIVLVAVRLHGAGGRAHAQDVPGDPAMGRRTAETMCSDCHAVDPKAVSRGSNAPAFAAIAHEPSATVLSLNAFLRSNHRSMPNFILARADADNIVAYILSLKRR
jgi:mono/diheme cytochrome c family protein